MGVATKIFLQATMLVMVFATGQEDSNPAGLELFRLRHEHNMAVCMAMLQDAGKEAAAMFDADSQGPADSLATAVLESCMLGLEMMQDLPRLANDVDVAKEKVADIIEIQKRLTEGAR